MNEEFKQYYKKYKDIILPGAILLVSMFVFFKVVLPQISLIADLHTKMNDETQKIAQLNTAISTINSYPAQTLDTNLSDAGNALPYNKNILSIFLALNSLSTIYNVNIDTFSLKVGGIYSTDKTTPLQDLTEGIGVPSVEVTAQVSSSDPKNIIQFSNSLYQAFPLSQVKNLQYSGDGGSFDLDFFYKPYDLNYIGNDTNVTPFNSGETKLLQTLDQWKSQ